MHSARVLAALAAGLWTTAAVGSEAMPAAQQNALVQKYCAVCHTDAARNGGLSLEHFDAAQAPPSLKAMLLSKLTGGVLLETAKAASSNASAAALVDRKMKSGAMGAAGIPIPAKATIDALIQAFAVGSAGATEWTVERGTAELSVSSLREAARNGGEAEVYRLIAACSPATQKGYLQLAWSPVAQSGSLSASVDGKAAVEYRVHGSEKMGNGSGLELHGLAALMLAEAKGGVLRGGLALPADRLTIRDLFPGETVTFSFANLPKDARQELQQCFPAASAGAEGGSGH